MLDSVFMSVLDMTVKGSLVILAVLSARLLLRRAPKVVSYGLWLVVLVRLLCPLQLTSSVSVLPELPPVSQNYELENVPVSPIDVGAAAVEVVGNAIAGDSNQVQVPVVKPQNPVTGDPDISQEIQYISVSPKDIWIRLGAYLWVAGVAVMALYSLVGLLRLKKKLRESVLLEKGIYEAEDIPSPFVMGLVAPKIYLPVGMEQRERKYILAHERQHIRRLDPTWKALGFLALSLHWFNPLVWVAFFLGCRDMEMSCDEAVLKQLGPEIRGDYAASLLKISTSRPIIAGTPLAFGEGDTKGRIKNLAQWKKPALWISVVAVVLCAVLAVVLLTDPPQNNDTVNGVSYFFGILGDYSQGHLKLNCGESYQMEFFVEEDVTLADNLKPGTAVMVRSRWDEGRNQYRAVSVFETVIPSGTDLDAVTEALLVDITQPKNEQEKAFVSFREVDRASDPDGCVTLYGLALCQTYANNNGTLYERSGTHIPVALTFAVNEEGYYTAVEYWMPRDGSYYPVDIQAKFPGGRIPDTQVYVEEQSRECMQKAVSYFEANRQEIPETTAPTEPPVKNQYGFNISVVPDDGMQPFEKLSRGYYEMLNVIQDGAVVMESESGYANVDVWYAFVRSVEAEIPARVRVVNYRLGSLINAEDIFFDGRIFMVRQQTFLIDGTPGDVLEHYYYHLKSFRGVLQDKSGDFYESYARYGLTKKPTGSIEPDWEDSGENNRIVFQIRQEYAKNPQLPENLVGAKLMLEEMVFGTATDQRVLASLENMIDASELVHDSIREFILDELYLLLQFEDGTELRLSMSPELDWLLIGDFVYDYGPGTVPYESGVIGKNGLLDLVRHFGLEDWPEEFGAWCRAHGMEPPGHSLKVLVGEEPHH